MSDDLAPHPGVEVIDVDTPPERKLVPNFDPTGGDLRSPSARQIQVIRGFELQKKFKHENLDLIVHLLTEIDALKLLHKQDISEKDAKISDLEDQMKAVRAAYFAATGEHVQLVPLS